MREPWTCARQEPCHALESVLHTSEAASLNPAPVLSRHTRAASPLASALATRIVWPRLGIGVWCCAVSVQPLDVYAGSEALSELHELGLQPGRVRVIVGASGGPKWLVLRGLDRVLMPWLLAGAQAPLHALGSSIGAWRLAALATTDPLAALDRFERAYAFEQRYDGRPSAADVSREGARILSAMLGPEGVASIVAHESVRLHIVTTRFRHLGALSGRGQWLGLGFAAMLNALARPALRLSIERVIFDAGADAGPFAPWNHLPTRHVPLTADNAYSALCASAAIPGVMQGVATPPGAPVGVYRDGGVADYHFGAEVDVKDGLTLYPHFYPHLVPGYFDKALRWRRTRGLRRTVLIAPSASFVASLPGGKIPDRNDFVRMPEAERLRAWSIVLERSRELGDAFGELIASGKLASVARALPV